MLSAFCCYSARLDSNLARKPSDEPKPQPSDLGCGKSDFFYTYLPGCFFCLNWRRSALRSEFGCAILTEHQKTTMNQKPNHPLGWLRRVVQFIDSRKAAQWRSGYQRRTYSLKEIEEPLPINSDAEQASDLVTDQYLVELHKLMSTEKLYRTATLSRSDVAELLGISPGYLSRKLAAHPAGNFTKYVNGYRVEEVKIMLSDPTFDDYSLAAIGLEAGFNSKSAFYKTFKSIMRCTPSEYKAIIREEG